MRLTERPARAHTPVSSNPTEHERHAQSCREERGARGARGSARAVMGMADGPPGGYFADGVQGEGHVNGRLFNETPPPPGQRRKWEDWEAPWYFTLASAAGHPVLRPQRQAGDEPRGPSRRLRSDWPRRDRPRV